jgi:hypothetical protein
MSTAFYRDDDETTAEETVWVLRCAAVYLAFPFLFFAFGWLNTGAQIILMLLLTYGVAASWSGDKKNLLSLRKVWLGIFQRNRIAFAVLLVWCGLSAPAVLTQLNSLQSGGESSPLKDLVFLQWPLHGTNHIPLVDNFFFYLPAAASGKILGWTASQFFLIAWTYLGLILVWSLFSFAVQLDKLSGLRKLLAAVAFVLAGGWDFFGGLLNLSAENPKFVTHLESWASIGQFSSHTTLLFRTPREALAPWIVTSAALLVMERRAGQHILLLLAALSFLWSPLPSLGFIPFIVLLFFRDIVSRQWAFFSGANFFAAPAVILLGILFYLSSSSDFSIHWQQSESNFARNITLLFLLEAVALSLPFFSQHWKAKVYLNQIDLPPSVPLLPIQKAFGWVAFIILALLPFLTLNESTDFSSRASIPAILILFFFWARILRREFTFQYTQLAVTAVCLLLGSGAALTEMYNSVSGTQVRTPVAEGKADLGEISQTTLSRQKDGRPDSIFWRWIGPQSRLFSPLK